MTEERSRKDASDSPWEDLVVSLLAVNQYSLERSYALLQGLRENKVTDPLVLAREETHELEQRLRSAGCNRGPFMTRLFAQRLAALGGLIRCTGLAKCEEIMRGTNTESIEQLLLPVKGIGPVVLRNFYILRDIAVR